jgi:hypothetical protein
MPFLERPRLAAYGVSNCWFTSTRDWHRPRDFPRTGVPLSSSHTAEIARRYFRDKCLILGGGKYADNTRWHTVARWIAPSGDSAGTDRRYFAPVLIASTWHFRRWGYKTISISGVRKNEL